MTFQDLGLRQELIDAVEALGFEKPMPVQEQVISFMLNNDTDLVSLAQTGTGKTAAFGLPILNMVDGQRNNIQALVLAPTRELCVQISKDITNYAAYMKEIKVAAVYGGESIVAQYRRLDVQPQILVATPGRLIDLINRGKVDLSTVRFLVLDEADEMLNMGFQEDLETILQSVPENRRMLLFSATMPDEIAKIARKYMHDAKEISVGTRNAGSDNVEHLYYMVNAANRYLALKRIVDMNPDIYGIVFCRTRQETKDVAEKLMKDGYNADALHGDLSQEQRDTVMNKFRVKHLRVLVATDVAARGLDVSDLTHVINYNLPDDVEVYTHRSGRTGRAGKKGVSCVIIHSRERRRLRDIEKVIKKEFKHALVPSGLDVCKRQLFYLIDRMEHVDVNNEEIDKFMDQIYAKLSYLSKEEIISRFVSLEFNRFLDYYKGAEDINVDLKSEKESRRNDRPSRKSGGKKVRFKMLYGTKQNASPRSVLAIINDTTRDKSISIGDIEITNKFTFFDVYADQADQVLNAFAEAGKPLSIAEPREVESKAPRANSSSQKRRYEQEWERERKHSRRENDSRRNDDNFAPKGGYRDFNRQDWQSLFEDDEKDEKPWRSRRKK